MKNKEEIYIESLILKKEKGKIEFILVEERGEFRDDPEPRKFLLSILLNDFKIKELK